MTTRRSDEAVLEVPCPQCGAPAGDACRTSTGRVAHVPHRARREVPGRRPDGIDPHGVTWGPDTRELFRTPDELPYLVDEPGDRPSPSDGHLRKVGKRRRHHRVVRTNSARRAFQPFIDQVLEEPGEDWYYFMRSTGEFSLLDAILVLADIAGPSAVTVETWSAALYDMEVLNRFIASDMITSFRLVLDTSFRNNAGNNALNGAGQRIAYATVLEDVFGPDAIRTTRTHAKAATITGPNHVFAILPSANLNQNMLAERFTITNAPEHVAWERAVVDELFDDVDPGWHPDRGAHQLQRFDTTGDTLGAAPMTGLGVIDL